MTASKRNVLHAGLAALIALVVLQIVWHGLFLPAATRAQTGLTLIVAVVPLLPGLWTCRRNLRRGVLIGGIVCLFYFCHGVSTAYADPEARVPALIETALSLIVIGALGWDARHYKRKPKAEG
ncbi:MAG TPA: DUF2069 domain-containing protein [Rudaea sp.]|nr:DUF2069 domain-containing protein [Rudaea sp.]